MNIISAENISKSYSDKLVLKNTSIRIQKGQFVCLMGSSGCGKTTLINIILGLENADDGIISGVPDHVAAVFQENRLCEDFSALSNVRMVQRTPSASEAMETLKALGLEEAIRKPVKELSGGMKRRVAIARALIANADFVVLDEPFKGLDDDTKERALEYVKLKLKNKSVLMVTHDLKEALAMGATVYKMGELGKIEAL